MLNFLGGTRGCAGALTRPSTRHLQPKNFEKTALRKRGGIFTIKMGGGHNYDNYCTIHCPWTEFRISVLIVDGASRHLVIKDGNLLN